MERPKEMDGININMLVLPELSKVILHLVATEGESEGRGGDRERDTER